MFQTVNLKRLNNWKQLEMNDKPVEETRIALDVPLKFQPILHGKIWGGEKIYRLLAKGDGKNKHIGESWELSDNDTEQSVVAEIPFQNQSFRKVFQNYAEEILGIHYNAEVQRFPLLYKFIDASDDLSVQVHPGENSPLGDSKTEAWYVVDAQPEAEIIVGIASSQPESEILEELKTSRARSVLNRIPVETGDVLFIPAGTVHAITKGLLIYEVQQNSDTTFRLYDWDRVDEQGNSRDLHTDQAAQVIDYTVHDKHKISPLSVETEESKLTYLVACRYFCLLKYSDIRKSLKLDLNNHFRVLTCLKGAITITSGEKDYSLKLGETMLIPAACREISIEDAGGGSEILASFIPLIEKEVIEPLSKAGFPKESIELLGGKDKLKWQERP
jgi:mannose-6-phosphate isomerase